jgi:hypothetical protein
MNLVSEFRKPLRIPESNACAVRSANPWHNSKTAECIEKPIGLCRIYLGQVPVWFGGTKVREDISDMVPAKSGHKVLQALWVAVMAILIGLAIPDEPFVAAKPAVSDPDSIPTEIMTPIVHIQSWTPK